MGVGLASRNRLRELLIADDPCDRLSESQLQEEARDAERGSMQIFAWFAAAAMVGAGALLLFSCAG